MNIIEKNDLIAAEIDGVLMINVCPHECTFQTEAGDLVNLPKSGVVIAASLDETPFSGSPQGVEVVTMVANPTDEGIKSIEAIYDTFGPHVYPIGSVLAAQAYPELVFGMIAAKGFERAAPTEKRMQTKKFTVFPAK